MERIENNPAFAEYFAARRGGTATRHPGRPRLVAHLPDHRRRSHLAAGCGRIDYPFVQF